MQASLLMDWNQTGVSGEDSVSFPITTNERPPGRWTWPTPSASTTSGFTTEQWMKFEYVFVIWRVRHYLIMVSKQDISSEITSIEQWRFFRVSRLLYQGILFFLMLSLRALDIHIYFQAFCSESVITVLTTKVFFGQDGLYKLYSCMGNALTACTFPQPRYNIFSWNCNMNNARRISYYVAKTYIVHNFKI